jgi:hypothetical protein
LTKSIMENEIPRVKKYMSERKQALQISEIAEYLGVKQATAWGILELMTAFEIVQMEKRGGRNYYLLKKDYTDEEIMAMLPPEKPPHVPKPRARPMKPKPPSFKEEYLSAMEEKASSGDGLPALALLGLPQGEAFEPWTTEPKPPLEMVSALMGEEKPITPIKIRPYGTVKHLPKDYRRLSQAETRGLKDLLKGLGRCDGLEDYNTAFSKASSLEKGRYGEVIYFSLGANQWDNVRRVTIDPSISDYMVLPMIEMKRWASWNDFLADFEDKIRYSRGQYDEMLDKFLESGQNLVEITVENRDTAYVKYILKKKIMERGIMDQVKTSRVDEWIYLERIE